jgi:hypothetical protein
VSRNEARNKRRAADDSFAKAREHSAAAEKRYRAECRDAELVRELLKGEQAKLKEYRAN